MNLAKGALLATGVNVEHVSPQELYDVMTAASSQDPVQIQESSKRLKQMLDMFGTFDALHEIAAQRTVPLIIRQQSIIQFKNAALTLWKSRKSALDDAQFSLILISLCKGYSQTNRGFEFAIVASHFLMRKMTPYSPLLMFHGLLLILSIHYRSLNAMRL